MQTSSFLPGPRRILLSVLGLGLALAQLACSEGLRTGSPDPTQVDSSAAAPHDGGQDAGTVTTVRGVQDAGLDLNDVSFLFPLPGSIDGVGELIGMTEVGPNGVILPRARLDQVLYFASGYSADALYAALRVVSARFDPCFPRGPEPTGCSKQIRLVAQPLVLGDGVPVQAVDAPIHLIYELSDDAFHQAHLALFELKEKSGGLTQSGPLDIHPVMRKEGLGGPYAQRLTELLRTHCGETTLIRVATMPLVVNEEEWRFAATDFTATTSTAAPIARLPLSTGAQALQILEAESGVVVGMIPSPPKDGFEVMFDQSKLPTLADAELKKAIAVALLMENPDLSVVPDLDCASCHLATRTRRTAELRRGIDSALFPEAFRGAARFDLRLVNQASDRVQVLRAFGYFGATGAWSQRTINESARVAELLSLPPGE